MSKRKSQLYNNNSGGLFTTSSLDFVEVPGTRQIYKATDGGSINISIGFTCVSSAIVNFAHTLFISGSDGSFIPFEQGSGVANATPNPTYVNFSYKLNTQSGQDVTFALGVKVFQGSLTVSVSDPPQITVVTEL